MGEVNVGNGDSIAFTLKNGHTRTFKYPGAYATFFVGIDRAGDAAGGAQGTHIQGPAFVMKNGGFINIAPPGSTATFMEAINDNGQVTGIFYPADTSGVSVFIGTPQ